MRCLYILIIRRSIGSGRSYLTIMEKYFDINENGYSIRCKIYAKDIHDTDRVVIFCHGFGGHKDTKAAATFADRMNSKYKSTALVIFDWPAHGKDALRHLTLEACDIYLTMVIDYVKREFNAKKVYAEGTSFGGYMLLKYISDHGNPFEKIVLRCPVIEMYSTMMGRIVDEDNLLKLSKGKEVLVGFDRKVKIDNEFLMTLKANDMNEREFFDYADSILIVHGTKDEVVSFEVSRDFSENNVIEFVPVEGADHRFIDPKKMDMAIHSMIEFLELG